MLDFPRRRRRDTPSVETKAAPRRVASGFLPLWLAAVLLPLGSFAGGAWWSWRQVEAEAGLRLLRTTEMLEESALRAFETHEAVLIAMERAIRGLGWDEIAKSTEIHALLVGLERSATALDGVGLVRPDGMMVAGSSRFPFPPVDVTQRGYFRRSHVPPGAGDAADGSGGRLAEDRSKLFGRTGSLVGEVVMSVPRLVPVFSLSRRRGGEGEGFGGLIVTAFAPDYFARLFERVAESPMDAISLFRLDGALLARNPPVADWSRPLGRDDAVLRIATTAPGHGLIVARAGPDGVERLHAVRRLGGYPVAVAYGLDPNVLQRAWRQRLVSIGAVAASAALLLLGLTAHATASARRAQDAAERARAEAERRAEAEAALRHHQRLEILGQVAAGVAHDFRNTVQAVQAGTRLIRQALAAGDPARAGHIAGLVAEAAGRGAALTERMLAVARRPIAGGSGAAAPRTQQPGQVLEQAVALLRRMLEDRIEIRWQAGPSLPACVHGAPAELEAALLNLAVNARDAMPEGAGGWIEVAAAAETVALGTPHPAGLPAGPYLRIAVADNGTGMDAATLARATEAFFTTKPPGQGTGLGLASVRAYVEGAGGALHVASTPGQGTRVTLWLPAVDAA